MLPPVAWERRGLVFAAPGVGKLRSHAMLPTPLMMSDRIRVFFSACDDDLRGRIYRIDLDRDDPRRIICCDTMPVLDVGPLGSFDSDGVNPSQIVKRDGMLFLYYIGWQRISNAVPYTLFAGLAFSQDDGLNFRKLGSGQILHANTVERFFRTAPFVFQKPNGWGMIYIGGGEFFEGSDGKRLPSYSLCQARSADGITWNDQAFPTLLDPVRERGEIGFGRPVLWHEDGQASLIISLRTESGYTIKQVTKDIDMRRSILRWTEPLPIPAEKWESAMTCFGAPCRSGNWEYLFYNGNQFGRSGFGVARRRAQEEVTYASVVSLITALALANTPG